jgi:nucleotide-binding universal stress UspA family protein
VLAVPVGDALHGDPDDPSWPGSAVVAALELDRSSRREAETAAAIAGVFGSSLLLLHVVTRLAAPAWFESEVSAHDRARLTDADERLRALAAITGRRVKTTTRVIYGRIAEEIAALAATEHCGLLLTALRDRAGWFGARRGSVSYQVIALAATPVLAYPSGWRPR